MWMDIVNYIAHADAFILSAWNAGYHFYFDSKGFAEFLDAWATHSER